MSKRTSIIVFGLIVLLSSLIFANSFNVFAADTESSHVTETIFFGNVKDDGSACGVFTVINLVVDILSIGIGILAAIGITISGIKYLTAGGNEEQTRKAKHRMYQIVIGLVAYSILYVGAQWLMPGGKLDFSQSCTSVSDSELAKIKEKEKKEEEKQLKKGSSGSNSESGSNSGSKSDSGSGSKSGSGSGSKSGSGSGSGSSSGSGKKIEYKKSKSYKQCMKRAADVIKNKICEIEEPNKRIAETAKLLAWPRSQANEAYSRATNNYNKAASQVGTNNLPGNACSGFVSTVLKASGLAPDYHPNKGYNTACINDYLRNSPNWKNIKKLEKNTPRPGDIAVYPKPCGCNCNKAQMGHTLVYISNNGRTVTVQANYASPRQYGYVARTKGTYHNSSNYIIYRYVGE